MEWNHWAALAVAGIGLIVIPVGISKHLRDPFFKCRNCREYVSALDGRTKTELKRDHEKVCFVD